MRTALVILLMLTCNRFYAQNLLQESAALPIEKVYLHLDRSYFSSGDNIWFKAYLTEAVSNQPFYLSKNLYVELISPELKVIDTRTIRVDSGCGNGDFQLSASLPSGIYIVRAYTSYMQNFGENFFFKRAIVIQNNSNQRHASNVTDSNNAPDIQFFAEGGSLVEDVPLRMAFKSVNSRGLGLNVQGKIVSSKGDTVALFASKNLGMGNFNFTSNRNVKYYAEGFTENGVPFKIELPLAMKTGYNLKVTEHSKDFVKVTVKTNEATLRTNPSNELVIKASSKNIELLSAKINMESTITTLLFPTKSFPEGISRITLTNPTGTIFAERLIFIQNKHKLNVHLSSDKQDYKPRGKVNLYLFGIQQTIRLKPVCPWQLLMEVR